MPIKIKSIKLSLISASLAIVSLFSFILLRHIPTANAADPDITNGIIVDSILDAPDDVIDGACDDGAGNCTLRAAIQEANSNADASVIEFNIGPLDGSVKTIALETALPNITKQVTIDGFTQDDASANTAVFPEPFDAEMRIELDGSTMSPSGAGLSFVDGSDGSIVRGLTINEIPAAGIFLFPGADHIKIKGNYIGTDPTGLIARGNSGSGVTSEGTGFGVGGPDYVELGGPNPEDRNILSANNTNSNDPNLAIGCQGVAVIHGSDHWYLKGNYIGIAADGETAMGNELGGITADYVEDLTIGGDQLGEGNIFSGNGDGGIQPDGVTGLKIQGNYVGTDYTGMNPVPNGTKGIILAYGTTDALVGGITPGAANVVAFNPWNGVSVWQSQTRNVAILGNVIHDNDQQGIDLSSLNGDGGATPNDPLDPDSGGNDLLNFPDGLEHQEISGSTTMRYSLDVPAGDYRVEFFANTSADPSGFGEGEEFLGYQNVASVGTGLQNFTHVLSGISHANISATATLIDDEMTAGFGNTSEFSAISTEYIPPPPVSDTAVSKTLTNPQSIIAGGMANYQITYTNNGPGSADLSEYGTIGGAGLFYDIVPTNLVNPPNPGYPTSGLPPGAWILDVDNTDLTCVYAPAPYASLFGLSNDTDLGIVVCWLTGADTLLESGSTITANIGFEVAHNSELEFTNYVLGSAPPDDPDYQTSSDALSSGDVIDYFDELESPTNNFAAAAYTPLIDSSPNASSGNSGILAGTGQSVFILVGVASVLIVLARAVLGRRQV